MLDFFRRQAPAQDLALAVGGPFLEDLVASELVVPDGGDDAGQSRGGGKVLVGDGHSCTASCFRVWLIKRMGLGCEPRSPAEAGGARRCSAQTRREFGSSVRVRALTDDNIITLYS